MENLFTYGSPMCDDILQDVAGFHLSCTPGVLNEIQEVFF